MKKRALLKKTAAFILAASIVLPALPVSAKNSYPKKIRLNRAYTSYDITGDEKPDKILISAKNIGQDSFREYRSATFYINGKKAGALKGDGHAYSLTAEIYRVSGGKKLLYVYFPGDNGDGPCRILLYKKGKLKTVLNMETMLGISAYGYHNNGEVRSVKGRRVSIRMYSVNSTLGIIRYTVNFKFLDGRLRPAGKTAPLAVMYPSTQETLTAAGNISVYARPGSQGEVSAVIRKDERVHAGKLWFSGNREWIYVTAASGEKGWIPAGEKYFSDAFYAG